MPASVAVGMRLVVTAGLVPQSSVSSVPVVAYVAQGGTSSSGGGTADVADIYNIVFQTMGA